MVEIRPIQKVGPWLPRKESGTDASCGKQGMGQRAAICNVLDVVGLGRMDCRDWGGNIKIKGPTMHHRVTHKAKNSGRIRILRKDKPACVRTLWKGQFVVNPKNSNTTSNSDQERAGETKLFHAKEETFGRGLFIRKSHQFAQGSNTPAWGGGAFKKGTRDYSSN